jgi:hypothetical protein
MRGNAVEREVNKSAAKEANVLFVGSLGFVFVFQQVGSQTLSDDAA